MQNYELRLYSINELKNIDQNKITLIQKYALLEFQRFFNKLNKAKLIHYQIINTTSSSKKTLNKKLQPTNTPEPYRTLESTAVYKANTTNFQFQTEVEKIFFICSTIFPDNDNFLKILEQQNFLELLNKLVINYNIFDNKYQNNPKLNQIQKNFYYNKFIKTYTIELKELQNYFFQFHKISNLNLIINKLFQIYFLDQSLYESYIKNNENYNFTKKLTK